MALTFDTDFDPQHGEMVEVSPLLRRLVCDNPSKFTFHGTGTYVIGRGDVAVVDPGPRDAAHVDNLLRALDGETVRHILVTHTHGDHSPAAAALAEATGATVLGFGAHPRSAGGEEDESDDDLDILDEQHATDSRTEDEVRKDAEDAEKHRPDIEFDPHDCLADGDVVEGPGWTIEALHTPGHISNHLCFALREEHAVLCGDHVMGWSTTIIPPPDGDVGAYLRSLRVLLDRTDRILYPTHGGPIADPAPYVQALYDHRLTRETQILSLLAAGPHSAKEIVAVIYSAVRAELHKPAARSVVAHLLKLHEEGRAAPAIADARLTSASTVWVHR